MNQELTDTIYEFICHQVYATPKTIRNELTPLFPYYVKDTLKRLINRKLNSLINNGKVTRYPFGSFYCLAENEDFLDFDLTQSIKRKDFQNLEKPYGIIVCSGSIGSEYKDFKEYYQKKKQHSSKIEQ